MWNVAVDRPANVTRLARLALVVTTVGLAPVVARSQEGSYSLATAQGLRLHDVKVEAVTYAGKRGVRVTISDEARRQDQQLSVNQQSQRETMAVIEGTDFTNGVIEAEVAGEPASGAGEGARGFVGIAFRVQPDAKTYDAFYLRPTNGRATDQVRRNHSAQYEVRGDTARLFVHGQEQPTLLVNDVKTGAQGRGAIALWIGPGTVAHFRDVRVRR